MNKDDPLVIERTGNGYQIRPMYGHGEMVCISDVMVFQVMGYASGPGEGVNTEDTLLGFIAEHFTEGKRSNGQAKGPRSGPA